MTYYVGTAPVTPYLEHFGILGMKWGQRRYQNSDGTLTANKDYKEAFDRHVANADYEAATRRAKAERGARDTAAVIKRGAKFAVAAAAVAIPVAAAYNNMKTGSSKSIEDYTAELLRKNLGKFNL